MRSITRAGSQRPLPYLGAGIEAGQVLVATCSHIPAQAGKRIFGGARLRCRAQPHYTRLGCGDRAQYPDPRRSAGALADYPFIDLAGRSACGRTGRACGLLLIGCPMPVFAATGRHPPMKLSSRKATLPFVCIWPKRRMGKPCAELYLAHGAAQGVVYHHRGAILMDYGQQW